jgi:hypothetical protein
VVRYLNALLRPIASLAAVVLASTLAHADVVTSLSGVQLLLTGDASPDSITVTPALDGLTVTGFDGTLVDGSTEGLTFSGVHGLVVKLMQGNDRLTIRQVDLPGKLFIGAGKGNDAVQLDQVFAGAVRIQTSKGYDAVWIYGPSYFDSLSVQMGVGSDLLVVGGVTVGGDLDVVAGGDDDDVSIAGVDVYDDLDVHLGEGDDFLSLGDVFVGNETHLDGDDGDDGFVLYGYLWFDDGIDVDGFGGDWWW